MKRGTPDHWKMKDLARRLNIPPMYAICWANGCLERLWHYAARYCLQGDIGRVPDAEIAEVCGWPVKSAGRLVDALVEARWLDRSSAHRLLIHDWPEHCDESVKKTLKNRGLPFFFLEKSGMIRESSGLARTEALASPSHSLSQSQADKELAPLPESKPVSLKQEAPADFVVWWAAWSEVRGTAKMQNALQAWMSVVVDGRGALECVESYLASLENPAKGFNPDNWIFEHAEDGFTARWPPFVRRSGRAVHKEPRAPDRGKMTAEEAEQYRAETDRRIREFEEMEGAKR